MNTGIQRSSATPVGAWTTTTPGAHTKSHPKKDMLAILAAHGVPYAATATLAWPHDLTAKVTKARAIRGMRFLHLLAPCPPGWKTNDEETIELSRLAVRSRVFPLVEVEHGETWRVTVDPEPAPVGEYLRRQGRFRHLDDDAVRAIEAQVEARWSALARKATSNG